MEVTLNDIDYRARVRGCLLGGAGGDALGSPVEFMNLDAIRAAYGPRGLTDYAPAYGRLGAITDDTQMSLWSVEGIIRASVRANLKGVCHPPSVVYNAYRRWHHTQEPHISDPDGIRDGWLWRQS